MSFEKIFGDDFIVWLFTEKCYELVKIIENRFLKKLKLLLNFVRQYDIMLMLYLY